MNFNCIKDIVSVCDCEVVYLVVQVDLVIVLHLRVKAEEVTVGFMKVILNQTGLERLVDVVHGEVVVSIYVVHVRDLDLTDVVLCRIVELVHSGDAGELDSSMLSAKMNDAIYVTPNLISEINSVTNAGDYQQHNDFSSLMVSVHEKRDLHVS